MNFIRKYLALLIPVGIIFTAVALFVPTLLTGRAIHKGMQSRIAEGQNINSILHKTPPKAQADVEKLYQDQHKKDADEVGRLIKQSTQRELISYKIFPQPKDTSQQIFIQFGGQYRVAIEELIKSIGARDAPSDIDIRKETESEGSVSGGFGGRLGSLGGFVGGRFGGMSGLSSRQSAHSALIDPICYKRAESIPVYANPNLFDWYAFWEDYEYQGSKKAIEDCWYSQMAYWIYEDVVETIKAMNAGSDCVYTSGVKRLVGVNFSKPADYADMTMATVVGDDRPEYIMDNMSGILGTDPWTDRICNNSIDVVHFSVSVIVDSKAFIPFIKELCSEKEHKYREGYLENGEEKIYKHNQITVLESKIEPVDHTAVEHEYYRYGDSAVVRLSLICEYVFNRSGYDKIKPEPINELLNPSTAKEGSTSSGTAKSKSSTTGTTSSKDKSEGTLKSKRELDMEEL